MSRVLEICLHPSVVRSALNMLHKSYYSVLVFDSHEGMTSYFTQVAFAPIVHDVRN